MYTYKLTKYEPDIILSIVQNVELKFNKD